MAPSKIDIPVVINGKVYTLSGYEGEDYLQNVATYINGKIQINYRIFRKRNCARYEISNRYSYFNMARGNA